MSHRHLTLLALSEGMAREARRDLEACGIQLIPFDQGERADGLLLTRHTDGAEWEAAVPLMTHTPSLLLVYGTDIPYGWTNSWADRHVSRETWEVVRLAFVSEKEKALLGGEPDGKWIRELRRLLAHEQMVSLVCRIQEVDEALRQLPRYLAWKERFYLELGEVCDREQVSLRTVARALGMDKRVGQGWLYPERSNQTELCRWIEREGRLAVEKANVHRIVLWGPAALWKEMETSWLKGKEVKVFSSGDELVPNEAWSDWSFCESWQQALQQADLLIIGRADPTISSLPLNEFVHNMNQANVVDACACFPLPEASSLLRSYRAIGEKTNVWE